MEPVAVSKFRPALSAGLMDQVTTGPPPVVGTSGVMAVPLVNVALSGL